MKKLLLLLFLPLLSTSQKTDTITYKNSVYVGQAQDGAPHGQGEMIFNDGKPTFKGIWKNGYEWSGATVFWQYPNKSTFFTGEIKNGEAWSGNINQLDQNNQVIFKGELKNGLYWNGYVWEKDCGERQKINIRNGQRNDRNHYNNKDIIGTPTSTTIKLKAGAFNKNRWKDNSLFVTMQLGGVEHDWYFDTGAESFNIPKKDWEKLKKNVKSQPLDICKTTEGITGTSNGNLVVIDEIKIGDYIVKNVIVEISDTDKSLLGISFFEKFTNVKWNMKTNTLTLYK